MTGAETQFLRSFLSCSRDYVEFGSGGSTALAASLVKSSIITVDSSQDWIQKVRDHCSSREHAAEITLFYADIGPIRDLGYPADETVRDLWPNYHTQVWLETAAASADLYLVDGRFRVACFLQVLLRASPHSIILMHDFSNRPHYHAVREFAREIASVEMLSAFQRKLDFDPERAVSCLAQHRFDAR